MHLGWIAGGVYIRNWVYSVEEVDAGIGWSALGDRRAGCFADQASAGLAIGMIFAIFRRFWAAAARWNSSLAPLGPRRRKRSSFRTRLRWAKSIFDLFPLAA